MSMTTQPRTSPTARSGTQQASGVSTLIVETARSRAHWAQVLEEYEHVRAKLEGEFIARMPAGYTTDVVQRAWLDNQLHQNAEFERICQQRLEAYQTYCLNQAQVDANGYALEERKIAAFDGSGPSVFAGWAGVLHSHGKQLNPDISPMDQPT